jgi:CRP/FNR family transcriptional regulator, dissimilatory nitrate respiration regulator
MGIAKTAIIDWADPALSDVLFTALPEGARKACRRGSVATNTQLFATVDKPQAMYFVISGDVRLWRSSLSGREAVVQRCRRGIVAEASLFQERYHCTATAVVETDVIVMPRKRVHDALDDPTFKRVWIAMLGSELRKLRSQVERLSLVSASDRIRHYIEAEGNDGQLRLRSSVKAWAGELGLTHEALYRALARMQRDGFLWRSGEQFTLLAGGVRRTADKADAAL